jgi:hypothetical protein
VIQNRESTGPAMTIRLSLDRFEGDRKRIAVLLTDDGDAINFPKALLPRGARPDDVPTGHPGGPIKNTGRVSQPAHPPLIVLSGVGREPTRTARKPDRLPPGGEPVSPLTQDRPRPGDPPVRVPTCTA